MSHESDIPLVVDVDGSLVSGDMLLEGIARLLVVSPLSLLALPYWLVAGRAHLKRRVAQVAPLPPSSLIYNPTVLEEINVAKAAGRDVWLASASDELVVGQLAEALNVTGYFASDGQTNLAGHIKATVLVERFGRRGFDYIGNERRDLAVWKHARRVIGVNLSSRLVREVRILDENALFLPGIGGHPFDYFQALRPHQWVKNVLVFVPLAAAHETEAQLYVAAIWLFMALSMCASGTYLFNDLLDLPYDRQHASKRYRPMAAGRLPLLTVMALGCALISSGVVMGFCLSYEAGLCMVLYLAITLAYSTWFKRKLFADVVTLAVLYMIRILAGTTVISANPSPWLLAFSVFIFITLAIVKRQKDLYTMSRSNRFAVGGRPYITEDIPMIAALGAASGFASIVVLALYFQSPEVFERYDRPEFLWLICPILAYWLGRILIISNRGVVDDDPVMFAVLDRTSWWTGIGILAIFLASL